ncbi:hypothetical protein [Arthrobacter sp. NPDC058192]|uniref:hypothetical protein n=1 Tax=Arthrobacter sp. NPDC058192 TaxID=3346372 RepID=UPI0036E54844
MTDQPQPLTAVLGEPGQRDAQGFGNVTTAALITRPISITDATGDVIYTKQTTDTQKAADNHIRNAGYRRVGPWADGVASVELVPLGAKLKKPLIALGVIVLVIAGVANFVARSYAAAPEAAEKSCHQAVKGKLPDAATPEFKSTSVLKNGTQAHGGYLYVVNGDVRSLDVGGEVREMTYRCEAYVDSSGGVHQVFASTTWK